MGQKNLPFFFPTSSKFSENWRCFIAALVSLSVITFSSNTFFRHFSSFWFRFFGSPTFFGIVLSCTGATVAIVSVYFPVHALACVSDKTQVAKLQRVNRGVVLFGIDLEVLFQKLLVLLATVGCVVSLLWFFQSISTNSAQIYL